MDGESNAFHKTFQSPTSNRFRDDNSNNTEFHKAYQSPTSKGFKKENFDDLPNHYTNAGEEMRGYELKNMGRKASADEKVSKIDEESSMNENLIYLANPVRQFSDFTAKAEYLEEESGIYMSEEFLGNSDFNAGDSVKVKSDNGEVTATIISDNKITGDVVLIPSFDSKLNSEALFSGYRFATASIQKV